jgi:hypothetical protein
MGVGEDQFAGGGVIRVVHHALARCELLAVVGAHEPLGAVERVLACEFGPRVFGFARGPPQIWRFIMVSSPLGPPGGDEVGERVKKLLQAGRGAQSAGAIFRVAGGFVGWIWRARRRPAFSRLDPLESGSAAKIGCPTGGSAGL